MSKIFIQFNVFLLFFLPVESGTQLRNLGIEEKKRRLDDKRVSDGHLTTEP